MYFIYRNFIFIIFLLRLMISQKISRQSPRHTFFRSIFYFTLRSNAQILNEYFTDLKGEVAA